MFYKIENEIVVSKSINCSSNCLFLELDLPIENTKLINGDLYDDRNIEYWKIIKSKELNIYLENSDNNGFITSLGFKVDSGIESINKLNLGLSLYNLNTEIKSTSTIIFCDFYNQLHEISFDDYKTICKEVGNNYSNKYGKKWMVRKSINEAISVDELKSIVI